MKKLLKIYIFIFFLLIITIPSKVLAEEVTCSKVKDVFKSYQHLKAEFDSLNCENLTSENTANQCNNISVQMNYYLQLLFEYSNTKKDCVNSDIQGVLDENVGTCTNAFNTDLKGLASTIMKIFYIVAPFLLILFVSLDLFKMVSANSPENIKKSKKNITIRITAFLLIFVTPAFVNFVLSFISAEYKTDGVIYTCDNTLYYFKERFTSNYFDTDLKSTSTLTGQYTGKYTIRETTPTQADEAYLGADNVGQCVWYARGRGEEIIIEMKQNNSMDETTANKIIDAFEKSIGNAEDWVSTGRTMGVKVSTNIEDLAAPAIIVWGNNHDEHGHVAIIEYEDESKVIVSEGYSSIRDSCPYDWSCVNYVKTTYTREEFMNSVAPYDNGVKFFKGYVFFTELEGE